MVEAYISVGEVMTSEVITIDRMATIRDAVAVIREKGVSSLVVERRDEADEFGMITVRDIATQVVAEDKSTERTSVYEIMSKPIMTVPKDMNIMYAVRLLVRFGMTRAVVTDNNRMPCGIVTLRDMVVGSERIRTGSD